MKVNCFSKSLFLAVIIAAFSCFCVVRCQRYVRHSRSFAEEGSTFQGLGESRDSAMKRKSTPLEYGNDYAYGCFEDIPIQNITLVTKFTPEDERAVLMKIFNRTNGRNWKNTTHWGNHSVSHCTWYGITCDDTNRYVVSIVLTKNNLIGTLPGNLWILRNLQCIAINHNNGLLGNINEILSANMTNLLRVDLAFNKLHGQIPGETLVQMKSLVKIQLCCQVGEKGLTGKIPEDIGNLTDLQVLSFGESRLSGSIPPSIGKLQKLWFLDIESVGDLQEGFENLLSLTSLRYMHLSFAGVSGTLPDNFGLRFPAMMDCQLKGNNFTGRIPSTVGNMTKLMYLNLADNNFCGQIPNGIGLLPVLQAADLSGNNLTSFEEGIHFTFQSLEVLKFAGNKQLTMSFEALLDSMEPSNTLIIFNISGCNFYGAIPEKLWENFQNLISVDLSKNRLSETLPSTLARNMYFLSDLDVSSNNLSGQIPQISTPSLKFLDVSNNPHMHEEDEHGSLPSFMTVYYTTLSRKNHSDNFQCPIIRLTYNNGVVAMDPSYYHYRLCICDIGYYGSGNSCLPCMEGAECKSQIPLAQKMTMKEGYWPSPRDQNVTHLVKCSEALGINSHEKTSCNPTGACDCWVREGSTSTVCNKSCLCSKGSQGRFCSRCENEYYKLGVRCNACPKTRTNVYVFAALFVLNMLCLTLAFTVFHKKKRFLSVVFVFTQIAFLAILALLHIIPNWLLELNAIGLIVGLAEKGRAARGFLKISIFYFQTLDAVFSNSVVWPHEVLETQHYLSNVFNFRFPGLACVFPTLFTPLGELLSLILLPIISIAGIWLYYGLGCVALRLRHSLDRLSGLRNSCLQLSVVSLNITYFPIVKKTAAVLVRCKEDKGYKYLPEAPWLECDGDMHTKLQAFGWLALVLYVVGIPFGVFVPLLRIKVARRDQLASQEQETLDSWLGSIYLPYKKKFRSYFEILFLLKRMLVAFSLSFVPRTSSFQTIAVCSVLMTSLCFQLLLKPFSDSYQKIPVENAAETLVLLTLNFSFMNTRYAALDEKSSLYITWMIIGVNGVLLCGMIFCIILLLGRSHTVQISQPVPGSEENKESVSEGLTDAPTIPLIENCPEEEYGSVAESRGMGRDVTGT